MKSKYITTNKPFSLQWSNQKFKSVKKKKKTIYTLGMGNWVHDMPASSRDHLNLPEDPLLRRRRRRRLEWDERSSLVSALVWDTRELWEQFTSILSQPFFYFYFFFFFSFFYFYLFFILNGWDWNYVLTKNNKTLNFNHSLNMELKYWT